jgi:hypothetical protein
VSGAPSTLHAVATRRDPLEATLAAGRLLLPAERRRSRLVLAALPVHLALSLGWAFVLARVLPLRRPLLEGAAAGAAIAALDLGLVGRRVEAIRRCRCCRSSRTTSRTESPSRSCSTRRSSLSA